MKRLINIVIIAFVFFVPIITNAAITNSSTLSDVRVYIICSKDNNNCDKETKWLKEIENDYTRLLIENIFVDSNKELVDKVKSSLKINKDVDIITIIGSNYFVGYDDNIKLKVEEAINSYSEHDNNCDIVSKIRDNEDIDECIKENKDIYKQNPSVLSVILTFFGIIFCIGIVFGIGFIVNKKLK